MHPRRIILAEDDEDDQHLFYNFLKHRNDIELMPMAEDGVVLIDLLQLISKEALPDIIILDQNMPKSNGLQTLVFLKRHNRYAHIPIMIYSTYADQQLIDEALKMGAASVALKPLDKEGYEKMIDGFLKLLN